MRFFLGMKDLEGHDVHLAIPTLRQYPFRQIGGGSNG